MVTKALIMSRLRKVIDPELGIDIVDLGLVYKVSVHERKVAVLMTLTTPGCPLGSVFEKTVTEVIRTLPGVSKVTVELTFDPPWTPTLMSKNAKVKLGFLR